MANEQDSDGGTGGTEPTALDLVTINTIHGNLARCYRDLAGHWPPVGPADFAELARLKPLLDDLQQRSREYYERRVAPYIERHLKRGITP